MKLISKIFGDIVWLLIIGFLSLPLIQINYHLYEIPKLNGAIEEVKEPELSLNSWFDGDYQIAIENYINENFGFHDFFIRLNNQLSFSIFKKAKAQGVIVGKKNYLFEESYIKAYYGQDYIGENKILTQLKKAKYVQEKLAQLNKQFILVYAPSKGSYFPEYFPDKFKSKKGITNYSKFIEHSNNLGLNHIDFSAYFRKNKYKSKYPLYPQYGVHWSKYGMFLAADSMVRYIENLAHIDMANFYYKQLRWAQPEDTDYDIAFGMNLLDTLKSFPMAYPNILSEPTSNKVKPSILVVSDSFYWGIFNFGFSNVFDKSHFWYYSMEIYPESFQSPKKTTQIDLEEEIKNHDIFIVLATEANLSKFGWGFIESLYEQLHSSEFN